MQIYTKCQVCGDIIYGAGDICKDCNECPSCGAPKSLEGGKKYDMYICSWCGQQFDTLEIIEKLSRHWAAQV